MSDKPATRKTGGKPRGGWIIPAILVSLVVYLLLPRRGFEDTWNWYAPEFILLTFAVGILLLGGAEHLLAMLRKKGR
jgi:hypothetical protein